MTKAESQNTCEDTNIVDLREGLTPETLVRNHAPAVLGLCLAHTQNMHDSEDIMQDVFLKAFTKLDTLRDPSRARAWLLRIARRRCIDHYRKRSSIEKRSGRAPSPSKNSDERILRLHRAISKLPDSYREPISLYYLNGRKCASVAKSLGISETAVRTRLARARLWLHEILLEDKL